MSIRLSPKERFITNLLAYFPFLMDLLDYSKKISFLSPHDKDYWVLRQIFSKDENICILDIGANIGQSSVGFRKLFPLSSIHALEANPDLAKSLVMLQHKGTIDDMTIAFVGCKAGEEIKFYAPKLRGYIFSTFASFDLDSLKGNLQDIFSYKIFQQFTFHKYQSKMVSLDSLAISSVHLIKIDVEGYELSVLEGARALIQKSAPVILLEINSEDLFQSIWHFATSLNYSVFAIKDQQMEVLLFPHFPLHASRNFLLRYSDLNPTTL